MRIEWAAWAVTVGCMLTVTGAWAQTSLRSDEQSFRGPDRFDRVVTIKAGKNKTPIENGEKLVRHVTRFASRSQGLFLLRLRAGQFDLGNTTLPLFDGLHIEGAGEDLTIIFSTAADTVRAENVDSGLRQLTLVNLSQDAESCTLRVGAESDIYLNDVKLSNEGNASVGAGLCIDDGGQVRMIDSRLLSINSGNAIGAIVDGAGSILATRGCNFQVRGQNLATSILVSDAGRLDFRNSDIQTFVGPVSGVASDAVAVSVGRDAVAFISYSRLDADIALLLEAGSKGRVEASRLNGGLFPIVDNGAIELKMINSWDGDFLPL